MVLKNGYPPKFLTIAKEIFLRGAWFIEAAVRRQSHALFMAKLDYSNQSNEIMNIHSCINSLMDTESHMSKIS